MSKENWTKETTAEMQYLTNMVVARKLVWHPEMEDIRQEAMMRLFEKRSKIPVGKTRKSYVCTLVRNLVNDFLRKQYQNPLAHRNRAVQQHPETEVKTESISDGSYTPEYPDYGLIACADRVVAEMLPIHQQVLALAADEYDYKEIATLLDISAGTVRSRLYYAKKQSATTLTRLMR